MPKAKMPNLSAGRMSNHKEGKKIKSIIRYAVIRPRRARYLPRGTLFDASSLFIFHLEYFSISPASAFVSFLSPILRNNTLTNI